VRDWAVGPRLKDRRCLRGVTSIVKRMNDDTLFFFFRILKLFYEHVTLKSRGGLGCLATWHFPGGPVGLPARWAATSNVGSGREKGPRGP